MPSFQIFLFGSPQIKLDNEVVTFPRRKAVALLSYLAVTQKTHTRDHLATLLWPENDQTSARSNLRRILYMLRKAVGVDYFEITRQHVGLKPREDLWTDVIYFQTQIATVKKDHTEGDAICDTCIATLTDAVSVYAVPFMDGFSILGAPAFDEWQFFSAESLQQSLAESLQHLIEWHTTQATYSEAIPYARRWLALDSLHEPAQRQLMQIYAHSGQQAAALRQYQECVRLLEDELGVEPEPETTALAEAIRTRQVERPFTEKVETQQKPAGRKKHETPSPPPHNLPVSTTPFIGREQELAQLAGLLADSERRMVTIVGPGGMGKTRLAVAAAMLVLNETETAVSQPFPDGTHFVPLAPLTSAEPILATIADSLHFRFTGTGTPKEQLLDYLRHQQMLLIMDNFEHVLAGAELITDILQAAPQVQILATSRERLNLLGETVLLLGGLDVPEETTAVTDDLPAAVQLWQQHAQLSQPNYTLQTDELQHIIQICQLVQGMPLALVLAAGWADMLPPAEIVAEIKQNLSFLETPLRDVPERQQSMRMVFDASWGRLTTVEQASFRQLSVFHGGFTRAAAQAVAGATLSTLRRLAHQSFVTVGENGRYQIHELLRQYAAEKLAENNGEAADAHTAHSEHYLNGLHQLQLDMHSVRQLATLNEIEIEFENIRAAWTWALDHHNESAIDRSLHILYWFFDARARLQEGVAFFYLARQQLMPMSGDDFSPVWGRIVSRLNFMRLFTTGDDDTIEAAMRQCLAIAQKSGNQNEIAFSLDLLASVMIIVHNDTKSGLDYFQQCLTICRAIDNRTLYSDALNAMVNFQLTDPVTATQYGREALTISQDANDSIGSAYALTNLSEMALVSGDYKMAEVYCLDVIRLSAKMDMAVIHGYTTTLLGVALFLKGEFEESKNLVDAVSEEARRINNGTALITLSATFSLLHSINGDYELAKRLGQQDLNNPLNDKFGFILSHWSLALAHTGLQENELAWEAIKQAVKHTNEYDAPAILTWILPVTAVLLANEGQTEHAVTHLALAYTHPQSPTGWLKQWPLLAECQKQCQQQLGLDCYQAAWARGQQLDLATVL